MAQSVDSSPSNKDIFSKQPDWMKNMIVDFLTAGEALTLSTTCRALRVVQLVSQTFLEKRTGDFWTGYNHNCRRWQWLRTDHSPAKVHSTLIKAQAWEDGADIRDGRLMIVASDNSKEFDEVGCRTGMSLPKGQVLPNKHGKNVFKTTGMLPRARIHCEFRPQFDHEEYSVWVRCGGGMNEINEVKIRQFEAKDLIYTLKEDSGDEKNFQEWQAKRSLEWDEYEADWYVTNRRAIAACRRPFSQVFRYF